MTNHEKHETTRNRGDFPSLVLVRCDLAHVQSTWFGATIGSPRWVFVPFALFVVLKHAKVELKSSIQPGRLETPARSTSEISPVFAEPRARNRRKYTITPVQAVVRHRGERKAAGARRRRVASEHSRSAARLHRSPRPRPQPGLNMSCNLPPRISQRPFRQLPFPRCSRSTYISCSASLHLACSFTTFSTREEVR
jgi:hypothetical protein